jgi:aspartate racemase
MKTIGLLGGMSWESTLEYYRLINTFTKEKLGGLNSAKIILQSLNFAEIAELQNLGDWQKSSDILCNLSKNLEKAGADFLLLCTNTMHIVAPDIEQVLKIPFIHICDAVANSILAKNIKKVGLLGTKFTMSQDFYSDRIKAHGLEVLTPTDPHQNLLHKIIYEELCLGTINPSSLKVVSEILDNLIGRGAEGIILGCTEIELLLKQEHSPVELFPTARIHCEAAVARALS